MPKGSKPPREFPLSPLPPEDLEYSTTVHSRTSPVLVVARACKCDRHSRPRNFFSGILASTLRNATDISGQTVCSRHAHLFVCLHAGFYEMPDAHSLSLAPAFFWVR